MAWVQASLDALMWVGPVESEGIVRGSSIVLIFVPGQARDWAFKLRYRNEDVLRWDLEPAPVRHANTGCPNPPFPPKVRRAEHEHRFMAGLPKLRCAVALEGLGEATHRESLAAFCDRTNIEFGQDYQAPASGEQLKLGRLTDGRG
jgi:hypothetical protein